MWLKSYAKLYWNSIMNIMFTRLFFMCFILSSCSTIKAATIAEKISSLHCSLTDSNFVEKLKLNEYCDSPFPEKDSPEEPASVLCMTYFDLISNLCETHSDHYYNRILFDENKTFNLDDFRLNNSLEVFLTELKEKVKNIGSFHKYVVEIPANQSSICEKSNWCNKFFKLVSSKSDCELICGDSNYNVKDVCNVLLWARTSTKEQSIQETIKSNNALIHESFNGIKPSPSSHPNEGAPNGLADNVSVDKELENQGSNITFDKNVSPSQKEGGADVNKKPVNVNNMSKEKASSTVSNDININVANVNDNNDKLKDNKVINEPNFETISKSNDELKNIDPEMDMPPKDEQDEHKLSESDVVPQTSSVKTQSNIMQINNPIDEGDRLLDNAPEQLPQDKQASLMDPIDNAAQVNDEFGDGATDDDGDDLNAMDLGAPDIGQSAKQDKGSDQLSAFARGNNPLVDEDSHFYSYFISMGIILVLLYLMVHYKKKLVALAVEGRRGRAHGAGRRRPNTASYSKLDSNLEEAMVSNMSQASVTHVLY